MIIDPSDVANGYAHPVAPTYERTKWLGAEIMPITAVVFGDALCVFAEPKSLWWVLPTIFLGVVAAVIVRFVNTEVDDRFFSLPMGFKDRGEYIGSSSLLEFARDSKNGNGIW